MSKNSCILEMKNLLDKLSKMAPSEREKYFCVPLAGGQDKYAGYSAFQRNYRAGILDAFAQDIQMAESGAQHKDLWYIACSTGCSCCSNENFNQGFYKSEGEAIAIKEKYEKGIGNPLASQYAKYGRYHIEKCEAEILSDGRMIINEQVFDEDFFGRFEF